MIRKIGLNISRKQPKQEGNSEPLRGGIKDYLDIAPQVPKNIFPPDIGRQGKKQDAF